MSTRRVAKSGAERAGIKGTTEERRVVSLTLSRRLAWGLGVLSRIRGVPLGEMCEPLLATMVANQRLPWSAYEDLLAAEGADRRDPVGRDKSIDPAAATLPLAGPVTPPEATPAGPPRGAGEGMKRRGA
jgi:hypothetical protein